MSETLESRLREALRRELGLAGDAAAGAPVVNVQPAAVHIEPRVVAEMPALPQPLLVEDVQRFAGNFEWQVTPIRGPDGVMVSAKLTPTAFVHFEVKP